MQHISAIIDEALQALAYPSNPNSLYEPIRYFMDLPGKRIRPVFCLLATELFRDADLQDAQIALSLELFHNFSLVHDDIMDRADLRRGFPTLHKKWNEPTALLAGDALLIFAYQALLKYQSPSFPELLQRFNSMALAVCEGQQVDMDFSQLSNTSVEDYLHMIDRKTGALIAFSFELGGFLAHQDAQTREALYQFGLAMGRCFQLRDDYLDLFGEEAQTGKMQGGDIANRKLSYPILRALNHPRNQAFSACWNNQSLSEADRIQKCLHEMVLLEIKEDCLAKIEAEMEIGLQGLNRLNGRPKHKATLEDLCKKLAYRDK